MTHRKDVLPNGISIVTEVMPHVRSVAVGIWVDTGSRVEPEERGGISHLIEHLVFKGTETRSAEDIARAIDSGGGQMDAFTAKEQTCFYVSVLDEHLPLAVDLLADILRHPRFTPEDIEKEKAVVLAPGERLRVRAAGMAPGRSAGSPLDRPRLDQALSWRRGEVVFDDIALLEAVAEMNRYSTRAIVVMHYGGVACEMDGILALASRHNLVVVEDNAHGLFAKYKGRPLGSLGSLATHSFHETKNVTSGEGGALLVNAASLVERAEVLREKGTNRSRFCRGEVDKYTWVDAGSNYLASEIQAAYLLAQLRASDLVQSMRTAIWNRYDGALKDWARANGVDRPTVPPHCEHPSHLYYLLMPTASARARLIEHLRAQGILAVFHYLPLNVSPMGRKFGGAEGACPVAEDVSERLLRLPFYTSLSVDDQNDVIAAVRQFSV